MIKNKTFQFDKDLLKKNPGITFRPPHVWNDGYAPDMHHLNGCLSLKGKPRGKVWLQNPSLPIMQRAFESQRTWTSQWERMPRKDS